MSWGELPWVIFNIDTGSVELSSLLKRMNFTDDGSCVDQIYPIPADIDPQICGYMYATDDMKINWMHCTEGGLRLVEKHSHRNLYGYDLVPRLEYVSLFLALKQRLS